jgi:LmbE family N-acetylglucosaminyl deacetylase
MKRTFLAASLFCCVLAALVLAQPRALSADKGTVGVGLALRRLSTVAIFMQAVAHPDDENNGYLVQLNRGLGVRTILATATRGDGGQNEIGPELFDALGLLRTSELQAIHRYDGAEQYFTRAVDFGYSFSLEETFQKWGTEEIVSDYVRLIRMLRPDVVVSMRPEGAGGGQHHQASAIIVAEAFRAAADPAKFPDQIKEGLRPWQPRKLYTMEGFGGRGGQPPPAGADMTIVNSEVWDPLLGDTYASIGSQARSNHKCQGMGQLLALPGPSSVTYRLADSAMPAGGTSATTASASEPPLFGGLDITIPGLAHFVRGTPPDALVSGLAAIAQQAHAAEKAFNERGPAASEAPVLAGLTALRALRTRLGSLGLDESGAFEIDYRLKIKETDFEAAALQAQALRVDILSDDGVVVNGQPVRVSISIANRGTSDVQIKGATFTGFEGEGSCRADAVKAGAVYRCDSNVRVAADAPLSTPYWHRLPDFERYRFDPGVPFGVPFRPTPFTSRIDLTIGGVDVTTTLPVQFRYEGNIFSGEKRMELQVVPRFSVSVTPAIAIFPHASATTTAAAAKVAKADDGARELRVTVVNGNRGASNGSVQLALPAGWQATPPAVAVQFAREDEAQTVRFRVHPTAGAKAGAFRVKAALTADGRRFEEGYQVVEYPHIERHQLIVPAECTLKVIDVKVPPQLSVGYVMGVGDQVPPALEQLGARVDMLDADDLAWGDLSRFDAIVTGVRAYERRADLRAHNQRLLEYVRGGGTVIVQYNKTEFNEAQYGPYPARVSSNRITDENAPVQVLDPSNPVFNFPNKIGTDAWSGWVQERGLYFLGDKDPHYVDLVQMEDPFPYNAGMKRGALVEATFGKGHWIYVGLGLWRQLPAGTDGAYTLFANLVSLGKAPAAPAAAPAKKEQAGLNGSRR